MGDQTRIGAGLALRQWIGLAVGKYYVLNHPALRLLVGPDRRLVPRLLSVVVLRLTVFLVSEISVVWPTMDWPMVLKDWSKIGR